MLVRGVGCESGGSWANNPRNCRSAYRNNNTPANRNNNIGFRVVCSAPSTLLSPAMAGQSWQMGICREYPRRVQTYSGDTHRGIRKSNRASYFGRETDDLAGSPIFCPCLLPLAALLALVKVMSNLA
ncbi:hypothetical protein [Leptothoe spongobia]|uniref:Sulfatase-modifying factor enzyme domain-containing protein n=1 Tax=Leptothoe spongobia TAU-MAC 1115 TaxID=1967444 RepID=A0A947GKX8_9CYAN|nr:hypothetical protein [Leptothoe spongobia]MBT9317904.1 hypothetical protein [Leptothoe spongobia TAU-MAC 1115]